MATRTMRRGAGQGAQVMKKGAKIQTAAKPSLLPWSKRGRAYKTRP